jgi:hypothetical protein
MNFTKKKKKLERWKPTLKNKIKKLATFLQKSEFENTFKFYKKNQEIFFISDKQSWFSLHASPYIKRHDLPPL